MLRVNTDTIVWNKWPLAPFRDVLIAKMVKQSGKLLNFNVLRVSHLRNFLKKTSKPFSYILKQCAHTHSHTNTHCILIINLHRNSSLVYPRSPKRRGGKCYRYSKHSALVNEHWMLIRYTFFCDFSKESQSAIEIAWLRCSEMYATKF